MIETTAQEDHLQLAQSAAQGEKTARKQVNQLVHPVIDYQTAIFCKRFCDHNRYIYRCTLSSPIGSNRKENQLCEWGNASYGWMLDDLTKTQRLQKYQARNGASLFDYLYWIANSLPFYERWKDWRFGRKINVPTYVQSIGPLAKRVFYALRSGLDLPIIAQQLSASLEQIENISSTIIASLTQHNRLYLLDPPKHESLTASTDKDVIGAAEQIDLPYQDDTIDRLDENTHLNQAWIKLDTVEQFVLEALVINEQEAQSVLNALKKMDISLKKGVTANQTTVQQLYYFKRKTLNKLAEVLNEN